MFSTLLTTLLVMDAVLLIVLIVALQQGNEGGLGSALGGGNASGFFGATGGVKFIVRATWICGVLFFLLALGAAWTRTHERYAMQNQIEKKLQAPEPSVPAAPPLSPPPAPAPKP